MLRRYLDNRLTRQINPDCDFISLSSRPSLTLETLKTYRDADWDWGELVYNPNFNLKWLKTLRDKPWDWYNIHDSAKFRMFWISLFPDKNWNRRAISCRATITDLKRFPEFDWNWDDVTCISHVTPQHMIINPDFPWNFTNLGFSDISFMEIAFLRRFKHRFNASNWVDFTLHAQWEIIKTNLDLPWIFYWIRFTPMEFAESDIDIIRKLSAPMNWEYLSLNVPVEYIVKNLDLPWVGDLVSQNSTLKYEHMSAQIQWDYSYTPCEPVLQIVRKWFAANKIKRAWRNAISNPESKMCRDRIAREFNELKISLDI